MNKICKPFLVATLLGVATVCYADESHRTPSTKPTRAPAPVHRSEGGGSRGPAVLNEQQVSEAEKKESEDIAEEVADAFLVLEQAGVPTSLPGVSERDAHNGSSTLR